jgi:hypothetical protein
VGAHVKLPGSNARESNVYPFGTPYQAIYEDLKQKVLHIRPLQEKKRSVCGKEGLQLGVWGCVCGGLNLGVWVWVAVCVCVVFGVMLPIHIVVAIATTTGEVLHILVNRCRSCPRCLSKSCEQARV